MYDFSKMDDIAFLAERKRVREARESEPSAELQERYELLTDELDRRARAKWQSAS
jgi:hypothetical protein